MSHPSPPAPTPDPAAAPQPLELLVVDADEQAAESLGQLLEQASGGRPLALKRCDKLEAALLEVEEGDFDVVLVDASDAETNPLTSVHALNLVDPGLPVVVLTGRYRREEASAVVRAGAQDYLAKSTLEPKELTRTIRHACERARRRVELGASHLRYAALLEENDQAALVLSAKGKILYLNPAASELLAQDGQELLGTQVEAPKSGDTTLAISSGLASVHVTDTLWHGRLATLVSVLAFAAADELKPSATGPARASRYEGFRTASPAMRRLFDTCDRVAPTDATVLLLGETGTGKELLARAVHRRSGRKGRFVAIDCGAVPETLIESELFGHERGAFTGASRKRAGVFERAHRGTLLLDEIGHLSPSAQHSLLRVLQERRVRPVGGSEEIDVDVRVIAATSVRLFDALEAGTFREDLLYRLDVIRVEVLPLRERPEDVLHLFKLFCAEVSDRYELDAPAVGHRFVQAMLGFDWPGNVRQLENFTERLLLTAADCDDADDFRELVRAPLSTEPESESSSGAPAVDLGEPLSGYLDRCERFYLEAALADQGGRVQNTAELAGVNRRTLLRKLNKHKLDKNNFK